MATRSFADELSSRALLRHYTGGNPLSFECLHAGARLRLSRVYGYHVQLKRGHEYDESLEERRADRASLKKYRDSQFPVLDPASARLQRSSRSDRRERRVGR